jgi:hypothetical protein
MIFLKSLHSLGFGSIFYDFFVNHSQYSCKGCLVQMRFAEMTSAASIFEAIKGSNSSTFDMPSFIICSEKETP